MSEGSRTIITRLAEGGAIGAGLAVIPGTDTNKQAKLPAAAGDRAVGVTFVAADAAGKPLAVAVSGVVKAVAGGALAVGEPVRVHDTDGRFDLAAPSAGDNANLVGFALTSAGADGDEFDLLICPSIMQTAD